MTEHSATASSHSDLLQRELWSSWAGVLRSYAAVHSLGRPFHAVVEVSAQEILLRYGTLWTRFTPASFESSTGLTGSFYLTVNGQVRMDGVEDEMDLAAERLSREIIVG